MRQMLTLRLSLLMHVNGDIPKIIEHRKTMTYLYIINFVQLYIFITYFSQSYFKDAWNTFDFITVVGSIVDALMVEFAVSITLN
jgi:hypothetical protein